MPEMRAAGAGNIADLSAMTGVVLPTSAVLVGFEDVGRGPTDGFYQWAVFSPTPIKLPKTEGSRDATENDTKYFQIYMNPLKIERPHATSFGTWEAGGTNFGADLLHTAKGDYLIIRKIKK